MGLFSKKTIICEKCGKEFSTRSIFSSNLCDDCTQREVNELLNLEGYKNYALEMRWDNYSDEQLTEIEKHRNSILNKYSAKGVISRDEIMYAADKCATLSDEQAESVIRRIGQCTVNVTTGAAYTNNFFVPLLYERVIVDANDVFAVGLSSVYAKELREGLFDETILCSVFTNDPYIPVFPLVFVGKGKLFSLSMKSKEGRQQLKEILEEMCPNLQYPVEDIKQLKKTIKDDGYIKGNIDPQFMKEKLREASVNSGFFDKKKLKSDMSSRTAELLDEYGYIQDNEINNLLKLDKRKNREFWEKQSLRMMMN